jgi:glycosyltransferase involved in cell wall biosynthesis
MMREESAETQPTSRPTRRTRAAATNGSDGAGTATDRLQDAPPPARIRAQSTPSTRRRITATRRGADSSANGAGPHSTTAVKTPTAPGRRTTRPRPAGPAGAEPSTTAEPRRNGFLSPENTIFVSLSFEGPDRYSAAGGLGTRVTELTESLASLGYETHLIFVGDPNKPSSELAANEKLHLKRWGQWISHYYPNGVYDGEEQKLYDYGDTVPYHIYEQIARPAIEQGKIVVIIGEDWHTADTIERTSDLLHWHNLRHRAILMWNCNSMMSLHRINWGRLNYTATITTVSRYMKHRLWGYGVNPLVIPNGIPRRYLEPVDEAAASELREVMQRGNPERLFLFKIGRFDPDKRWLMAVEAAARLKHSGHPVAMVIRGGIEPHGGEVLGRAHYLGLNIRDIDAHKPALEECVRLLRDAGEADIYNLKYFVPEEFVRTCYTGADAVLANSGHEPFGLVGLEVMAASGIAFTGSTGEDYALSFENAVALETDDPEEIVGYLMHLQHNPADKAKIRANGRRTAAEFTWDDAIDNLGGKLEYLARKQGIFPG